MAYESKVSQNIKQFQNVQVAEKTHLLFYLSAVMPCLSPNFMSDVACCAYIKLARWSTDSALS